MSSITALEKIEGSIKKMPLKQNEVTESTAHMFILNPFSGGGIIRLLSTHPKTEERANRLRKMNF